jgi:hydrogenase nickel incorporation protein HypA/HybF
MLMHETMVADSIVATILDEAAKLGAKPVSAKISCGTLNAINDEVLDFAFKAIAKGTACEGMKLLIDHKSIQAKCRNCKRSFDIEFSRPICTQCGSEDFDLLPDAPLILEEIEFQEE